MSLLILFFSFQGFAFDTCEEFRLDAPGQSMEHIPVYDQRSVKTIDEIPICYAASTAQTIDACRFAHGDKNYDHITSPVYLAARASSRYLTKDTKTKKEDLNFGWPDYALYAGLQFGSCDLNTLDINANAKLEYLYKTFDEFKKNEINKEKAVEEINQCAIQSDSLNDTARLALALQKQFSKADFVDALLNEVCHGKTIDISDLAKVKHQDFDDNLSMNQRRSSFEAVFNRLPRQPITMGVHTRAYSVHQPNRDYNKESDNHAITAIGQRYVDGKCQILLRDSYGKDRCHFDPPFKRNTVQCEEGKGQFWIDRDTLLENTFELNWLE